MKKISFFVPVLCVAVLFAACKSQESAYRRAFEKAQQNQTKSAPVVVIPQEETPTTVVAPVESEDATPVRVIPGGVVVVDGDALKSFNVVVGSFVNRTNADGLATSLRSRGYSARVVKTNETINGHTGWYRVIASSFDSKAQAVQSKQKLVDTYPGAWLLLNK